MQLIDTENLGFMINSHEDSGNSPDLSVFNQFANNDPEALKKIIISLANSLSETAQALQIASGEKDFAKISLMAHRILPNLRNLKATDTVSKLLKLENVKRSERVVYEEIEETIASTIADLKKIENDLRALLIKIY
jgi:HPt (histidine-containing phosphotransfer) domain-containing protein